MKYITWYNFFEGHPKWNERLKFPKNENNVQANKVSRRPFSQEKMSLVG